MADSTSYEIIKLSPLRKIIAARMTEAKQTIPHFRVCTTVEMDSLLSLRNHHNTENPDRKISVNDFIVKAGANALMAVPEMNIQFVEGEIHRYRQADISVVIAVEGGLSTPVVRAAEQKSIYDISAEIKDFANRAKLGQIKLPEITGGTFSISNLGMYNIDQFDAIINPPQGAILAVAGTKPRVVSAIENDRQDFRISHCVKLSLSLDHRVLDGAVGAQFMNALREQLMRPEKLLV